MEHVPPARYPARKRDQAWVWLGVLTPLIAFLLALIFAWNRAVSLVDLALLVVFYSLTLVGIGLGYHRHFTHRAFEAAKGVRVALAILGSMAIEGRLFFWVALHRHHHRHSDTHEDPHSPWLFGDGFLNRARGLLHAHIGWAFDRAPEDLYRFIDDLTVDPTLRRVDRLFLLWAGLGLMLPAVLGGLITLSWAGALTGFLWGGLVRVFLMHHVTWSINSVCHMFGYRSFSTPDHSGNIPVLGFLGLGEGLHNNHHAFPRSARFAHLRREFDPGWPLIRLLERLGWVWNVQVPSPRQIDLRLLEDTGRTGTAARPRTRRHDAPSFAPAPDAQGRR